ncbi:MAG: PAS domain S-box protein [Candidatus Auribacter fodinae]|jgi:PAS domain S-box-containing protein|uniref:histidine kinase n=1 Tax=Candidatus Auribacter fodinae TaxID=2093366 RepID=A0A3A4R4A9_9BACT|nr:MAG: PAS domain S-box protein [Candidatus Auribacter fodinae]
MGLNLNEDCAMFDYQLRDLLDLSIIQKMADSHYRTTGMPIGIIDAIDDSVLVGAGWQDICVYFHRANPISLKRCRESDSLIKACLVKGEAYQYKCKNGLWDIGMPIIVSEKHLATMFLGQFFYEGEKPDRDFFITQAHEFNFELESYLSALDCTPVFTHEKVNYILEYDKALINFISDIAENTLLRIKANEELRMSEERYSLAQRVAKIGSWDWNIKTGDLHWSDQVGPLFGFPQGELKLTYEDYLRCVYPPDRQFVKDTVNRAVSEHQEYYIEHRIVWPDSTIRWISATGSVFYDSDNNPVRMLGVAQDITERKHHEERTENLLKEMEQRNAEMERFLYTASHDLKTPLITIEGFLGLLEQSIGSQCIDKSKDFIRRMNSAARKMRQLLEELVELSKVGRIIGTYEHIDFKALIDEAKQMFEERLRSKNIAVIADEHFPAITGDRKRLLEVMVNLIDNAVKYIGNTPEPRIKIGSYKDGNDSVIYIEDNGMGMNPKYFDKVFNLFEKLDHATEGSGIGLALVKRIIDVHGGRIWIESDGEGKGCSFHFTIPSPEHTVTDDVHK